MNYNDIREFLESQTWTFAKSMPKSPHWYIVRERIRDDYKFDKAVIFIRHNGKPEKYFRATYIYFYLGKYKYWTMGAPINETIIINRAEVEPNDYDKIADVYDDLFVDDNSIQENKEVISMIDIKGRVLDIGCGTGLLLDYANISPENYVGLDPSAIMLANLNKKHPLHYVTQIPFEEYRNGTFDTIISLFGSPSYIRPDYINDIKNLLNIGGEAFLMFYNNDYVPVTYIKTGIFFKHYDNNIEGQEYHNYKIVRIRNGN